MIDSNAIAAIIGVVLGTAISGFAKLWSRCEKQKQIKATVKHDLQALWNRLYLSVKDFMSEYEKNRDGKSNATVLGDIGITQNYFSCFEAITGEIAVLPDSGLSQEIFDTYTTARGVVDTILMNNKMGHSERLLYRAGVYKELNQLKNKVEALTTKL